MGKKNTSTFFNKRKKDSGKDAKRANKKIAESHCKGAPEDESPSIKKANKPIKNQDKSQARKLNNKQKIQARGSLDPVIDSHKQKGHSNKIITLPDVYESRDQKHEYYENSTKDVVLNISPKNELTKDNNVSLYNGSSIQEKPSLNTINVVKETTSKSILKLYCPRRVNIEPVRFPTSLPTIQKKKDEKGFFATLFQRMFCCSSDKSSFEESSRNTLNLEFEPENSIKKPQDSIIMSCTSLKKLQTVPQISTKEEKPQIAASNKKTILKYQGLPNIGSTCYMNSTLQCLFASKTLMAEINSIQEPGEVTSLFKEIYLYTRNFQDYNRNSNIKGVLKRLLTTLEFEISRENDAHAFYMTLLDRLSEEHKPLDKFFFGEFHHAGNCDGCGPISSFEEPFTELVLPSKKKCSQRDLATCINFCFNLKRLECCKCKLQKVLKPTLSCAPEILVLLFEKNAREDIRVEEMIAVPMDREKVDYTLLGMIEYSGNGDCGHYTAITWHVENSTYYRYNDLYINNYSFTHNSRNTPLLCFYEKV